MSWRYTLLFNLIVRSSLDNTCSASWSTTGNNRWMVGSEIVEPSRACPRCLDSSMSFGHRQAAASPSYVSSHALHDRGQTPIRLLRYFIELLYLAVILFGIFNSRHLTLTHTSPTFTNLCHMKWNRSEVGTVPWLFHFLGVWRPFSWNLHVLLPTLSFITARPHCFQCRALYYPRQFRPSICLSVCLFVCPSHARTLSRRMNLGSGGFHSEVAKTF